MCVGDRKPVNNHLNVTKYNILPFVITEKSPSSLVGAGQMEVNGSSHTFHSHLSKDSFSLADESSILGRKVIAPSPMTLFPIVSYFTAIGLSGKSETRNYDVMSFPSHKHI